MIKPYYDYNGITIYHGDCLEILPELPKVDLVLTDPPYGGGDHYNFRYKEKGLFENKSPEKKYFDEIIKKSKNQIIWGGNYFTDKISVNRCWLCWLKSQPIDAFSDFELAWTSFDKVSKKIDLKSYGFNHADKRHSGNSTLHPTQKPVALFRWCIEFSKTTGLILDPFLGSGTTAVACKQLGRRCIGIEIEEKYCEVAAKRLSQEVIEYDNSGI